jgi:hypothetical protein
MEQTKISIETARVMYMRGGTAKEFALKIFTETELQKPSYPKQTAVEWLEQAYWDNKGTLSQKHFDQAKQMEKEQITDSYIEGHSIYGESTNAEQYYNETYGQTKN